MDVQRHASFVRSASWGGYALIALGLSVLLGWTLRIGFLLSVLPGRISMKPNTAAEFLFAGIALVLLTRTTTKAARIAAIISASLVLIISILTLVEYLHHSNFSVDQLLFRDLMQHTFPGRMAPITTICFCLTGASLLLMALSEKQAPWPQLLSLLAGFSATLAIIGYLYGVPVLYGSVEYTSMAIHTGLGLIVLSGAILHCRPELGVMKVVSSEHAGGWIARRLLPLALIVPTLIGAIYVQSRPADPEVRFELASLIVTQIVLFVGLVWALAFLLNRLEADKTAAQFALKRSEERLEQSYRTMFEEALVGMFRSTPGGRFLSVNQAMATMFGYSSPLEMIENITDIGEQLYVDASKRGQFISAIDRQGAVQNLECQVYRKDGRKIWICANVRAIYENGTISRYEGTNSDITERKLLEEQLAQSQKMEAIGRLAGGIAHDFNNAIGVIVGFCALLRERVLNDEKCLQYTEQISTAGHRAASLTRQLLAFSRKQVIQPAILDLNTIVSDTQKMLGRLIGEDIEVRVNLDPTIGRIKADRGQLEQVLMNLAVNARDAMPTGGKLIIETSNAELDETTVVRHPCAKPGHYVVLSVSDTGCGMDKETQTHIFEPFFTTKAIGRGTGLGLSTVYGIVQQSEGYIWLYSEPGKGARFKIYWPRTAESAQTETNRQAYVRLPGGSETILLVEDDDAMRELTSRCLTKAGYVVLNAADGEAAIRLASENEGPIHLLLSDVVMPGLCGRRLAETLVTFHREMRVLFMSGYTADLIADHGVLRSDISLLEKPFTQEALLNTARNILDGGYFAAGAGM